MLKIMDTDFLATLFPRSHFFQIGVPLYHQTISIISGAVLIILKAPAKTKAKEKEKAGAGEGNVNKEGRIEIASHFQWW